ncbi:MAG: 3-phosphoshikimate 1-carboxyvinyltransferase [Aridibacter sp.]
MKIKSANLIKGEINLPGDKSISHRAAMLLAMAEGEAKIENFSTSEDCTSTLNCLQNLGVEIERNDTDVFIKGVGKKGFAKPEKELDCGNSGTTMRLIAGILAGQNFASILIGDESLQKRPMERIIKPLQLMGAKIESDDGTAPLTIHGKNPLKAIEYILPIASAQVKSCVLLAGLNADGTTKVLNPESKKRLSPSRNHTELMFEYLEAKITEDFGETGKFFIHEASAKGNSKLRAKNIKVPADISSASFFLVAAGCLEGSEIIIKDVGLNITRSAIIEIMQGFGVEIEIFNKREISNEIIGDLRVLGKDKSKPKVLSNKISGDIIANLIDEIPALAVFGTQIKSGLEIKGAEELRAKESDRISAVVENLRKMDANIQEFPDGFRVEKSELKGAKVDSYGDHRIAMAFAIAGLFAKGETEIINADCVKVSFPEFFQVLQNVIR